MHFDDALGDGEPQACPALLPGAGGIDLLELLEDLRLVFGSDPRARVRDLEDDGGISPATVQGAAAAGANVLISGSSMFKDPEGLGHAVDELRALAEATRSQG